MTTDCFDEAFDAFLARRPVPAEAAVLVAFAEKVREVSALPGRPSPELAELLANGLLTASDTSTSKTAQLARTPDHQGSGQPRRRRTMFGFLAAGAAKFASAGAVAQAATGLTVALASVTGAGAAGVLPDAVQDHVSSVVEAVTPFELPESSSTPATGETATTQEETAVNGEVPDNPGQLPRDSGTVAVTPEQAEFGRAVSSDAQKGEINGGDVSSDARSAHQPERPNIPAPAAPEQPETERPDIPAPAAPERPEAGRPDSAPVPAPAPAPADQASDHVPAEPGRP